jgi:hypothetical protein
MAQRFQLSAAELWTRKHAIEEPAKHKHETPFSRHFRAFQALAATKEQLPEGSTSQGKARAFAPARRHPTR